jgi:hypothetical protein
MTLVMSWIFVNGLIYSIATVFVSFFFWYWVLRFFLWILKFT